MMDTNQKQHELDALTYNYLKELYDRIEPYHYVKYYCDATEEGFNSGYSIKGITQIKNFTHSYSLVNDPKITKILKIEPDLINLLYDTKPCYDNLKIKYPSMFINHQFKVNDKFIINGLLIIDLDEIERIYGIKAVNPHHADKRKMVLTTVLNTKSKYEFYSIRPIEKIKVKELMAHYDAENFKEKKDMLECSKLMARIACNICNLIVNDEKEIEYVNIQYPNSQNQKRASKGKLMLRDHTVLRLSGKLKKYVNEYNTYRSQGKLSARYFVSGHWRKFNSEFYKKKQGTKIWIYPYYRGMDNLPEKVTRFVEVRKK